MIPSQKSRLRLNNIRRDNYKPRKRGITWHFFLPPHHIRPWLTPIARDFIITMEEKTNKILKQVERLVQRKTREINEAHKQHEITIGNYLIGFAEEYNKLMLQYNKND